MDDVMEVSLLPLVVEVLPPQKWSLRLKTKKREQLQVAISSKAAFSAPIKVRCDGEAQ